MIIKIYRSGSLTGGFIYVPIIDSEHDVVTNPYDFISIINSETFPFGTSPKGRCFTFWYYMSGNNCGSLKISAAQLQNQQIKTLWFQNCTDLGKQWNYGSFGFYLDGPYEIILEGARGNPNTILAIDDIYFKESQYCSVTPPEAKYEILPLPTQSPTTTPTSTIQPSVYDCDFENENRPFCNWNNDYSRPLNWTRMQGKSPSFSIILNLFKIKPKCYYYIFSFNQLQAQMLIIH